MNLARITTFPDLIEHLRDHYDWPFFEEDPEDNSFEYTPDELGIDPRYAVGIERIARLRPSEESGPWGIFYIEFGKKRLPLVVLRRILRALVPKARASANAASRPSWQMRDLLFICSTGESGARGVTFAHFREVQQQHIAQLRTFSWDEGETHFAPTLNKLEKLRWENQDLWEKAFTLAHGQLVGDSKELASELASFARGIRERTLELYNVETADGQLHTLHKAFQSALIADMTSDGFADTVAQTIAYGLFAGRATGATLEKVGLAHLETFVPKTNPFLRELFAQFTRLGFDVGKGVDFDDLGIVDLVEFLNGIPVKEITENFGRQSGGGIEDPVVYFYENFLKEYDAKQRVQRGVYYTPKPVVDFIVRGVHQLLIDELDCPDGLADLSKHRVNGKDEFKVMILDPATGTGTFLQSAIEVVHDHLYKKWRNEGIRSEAALKAKWNEYVPIGLLPRLHGFELMMASYTVAHMKLGLKLQELGYEFGSDERLRVFLTNTLEPPHEGDQKALGFPDFLAHEAQAADQVKGQTPISVIIGNPPYSAISANLSEVHRRIVDAYRYVDGLKIKERNMLQFEKNIQDDYVKFFAWSQRLLSQSSSAIFGMVTNHSYIDSPTLRGMRQSLMTTFERCRFIDLHGNSLKSEKSPDGTADQNVFDIQQGVAVAFLSKHEGLSRCIQKSDLFGVREEKYVWLRRSELPFVEQPVLQPESPQYYFFDVTGEFWEEWKSFSNMSVIMPHYSTGTETGFDELLTDFDKKSLKDKVKSFVVSSTSTLKAEYGITKGSALELLNDRKMLDAENADQYVGRFQIRCFDYRFAYLKKSVLKTNSFGVFERLRRSAPALIATRQTKENFGVFAVNDFCGHKVISSYDRASVFPLFSYPAKDQTAMELDAQLLGTGKDKRRANLAPEFVAQLGTNLGLQWQSDGCSDLQTHFGPEDVLAYIYAVFHAPVYRARYAGFLKTDFPRVPLTNDAGLFRALVEQGRELLALHTMENPSIVSNVVPSGEIAPGFPKYEEGRVLINKNSGFDDVSETAWNFHIGGYQVAHKWLKDRKGRALTADDAMHYRRIIAALDATQERMDAIDDLIENAGGFPLSGSQEAQPVDVRAFFGK